MIAFGSSQQFADKGRVQKAPQLSSQYHITRGHKKSYV